MSDWDYKKAVEGDLRSNVILYQKKHCPPARYHFFLWVPIGHNTAHMARAIELLRKDYNVASWSYGVIPGHGGPDYRVVEDG